MRNNIIIEKRNVYQYFKEIPFRPSKHYPEYLFDEYSKEKNDIYDMVRNAFALMGYDSKNYGIDKWNPLGELVKPGNKIVIKPNLVMDNNYEPQNGTDCLFTQPSIVAAVLDYVIIALKGKGSIIVGDAPMQECNFDKLIHNSGYDKLIAFYKDKLKSSEISIELIDFRGLISVEQNGIHISRKVPTQGIVVDLQDQSEFYGTSDDYYSRIRITNYDPSLLKKHHNAEKNEYYINKNVLDADVFINMPKPKTHRKAGVTISLKNIVGINCRKEYLPHHANGSIIEGGDEYYAKSMNKWLLDLLLDKKNSLMQKQHQYKKALVINFYIRCIRKIINLFYRDKRLEGNWSGNDTISRTIVDLNKILFYANKDGILCNKIQRKYLVVADLIISGEHNGPVSPSPRNIGVIAMGENPVSFDETIASLMGAEVEKINTLKKARGIKDQHKLIYAESDNGQIISNNDDLNGKKWTELDGTDLWYFEPADGWEDAFRFKVNS